MAFGTVRDGGNTYNDVATLMHSVGLPASIVAGDLLVIVLQLRGTQADVASTPSGWTRTVFHNSGVVNSTYVFTRRANGAEGPSVTITTSSTETSMATSCAVEDAQVDELAVAASGTGTSMTPNAFLSVIPLTNYVCLSYNVYETAGAASVISGWPAAYTGLRNNPRRTTQGVTISSTSSATSKPTPTTTLNTSSDWLAGAISFTEDSSPAPEPDWELGATFGSATQVSVPSNASRLECCSSGGTNLGIMFGSDTWVADAEAETDGLARYYPLGEVIDNVEGVDIANGVTATGQGFFAASPALGKMCEYPEVFKDARNYIVPLVSEEETANDNISWQPDADWTVSMMFNLDDKEAEQTLFAINPSLRFGVSWARELTMAVTGPDGQFSQVWSSTKLSDGTWHHVAIVKEGSRLTAYLDGSPVATFVPTAFRDFVAGSIGSWQNASLASGLIQDLRIYDHAKPADFLYAESQSYCADWVAVV